MFSPISKLKEDVQISTKESGAFGNGVYVPRTDFNIEDMRGVIDSLSISLNASDAEKYLDITKSRFGIGSYDAMLSFAADCHKFIPDVKLTVVDVIGEAEVEKCRGRAESIGVPLRVRTFISNNREYD